MEMTASDARAICTQDVTDSPWSDVMRQVLHHACLSPDPSTQNAAAIGRVSSHGFDLYKETWAVNEFPGGVTYGKERWLRPEKYQWIEHAERNAIYAAARAGVGLKYATMVCPWAACADCARAIIQSGITTLVTLKPAPSQTNDRWDATIAVAMTMLEEAGVKIIFVDGHLGCTFKLRRNGEEVTF